MVKIKDIPINDRPIERLINYGSEALSNEELLAILLKTGTKNRSSKELAAMILTKIKNIKEIYNINLQELKKIQGIGDQKASTILALSELAKRINSEVEVLNNKKFTNPSLIFNYYKSRIGNKKQEYFYCVYLDNSKKIIKEKLIYIGTIDQTLIHPRDIFKEGYKISASSIICIHNHPAGTILPSKNDLEMTSNLKKIGEFMGIKIIDHIIITENNYYSFFENNEL